MEGYMKRIVHAHLWLLAVAGFVILSIELYKFIKYIVEH
jgi:hypothetical protein